MLAAAARRRPPAARSRAPRRWRPAPIRPVKFARSSSVPDDVEREVLEHPRPHAVALPASSSSASRHRSSTGSRRPREPVAVERAVDDVATHQPVIGSLRSSNRPAPRSGSIDGQRRIDRRGGDGAGERRRSPARFDRRGRSGGASSSPRSPAIEVETTPGHPARVDELEVGEVDRHVERDPVVADAALDAQAERADLARRRRRPGRTSSPGWPSRRAAATPSAAQVSTIAASSARTSGRTQQPAVVRAAMIG